MSDNIEIINGRACMAWSGDPPWHGLGKRVHYDLTPAQMMHESGTDWRVVLQPLYYEYEGKTIRSDHSALMRETDGTVFDTVPNNWVPNQNEDAFAFFHEYVMAGDMQMHTAGSLDGGRIVWALAKVNDGFTVFGRDEVESYMLFSNPHKHGAAIDVRFTPERVVCKNTLAMALSGTAASAYKATHRKAFNPEVAKKALGLAHKKMEEYKEAAEFLGSKRYDKDSLEEFLMGVFPISTRREGKLSQNATIALDIVEEQPGANFAPGTWWNAFNSVTFCTDHVVGRGADSRLTSAWFGNNKNTKIKALESALEYATAA